MYIQGMAQQTQVFMLSTGFGFLAGALYDVIRFIRKIFSSSVGAVIFQDILFFIICTFGSFFFLLCVDDGKLRAYPYLGMLFGFFIWYFTLGLPVSRIFNRVSAFLNRLFKSAAEKTENFFKKTLKKNKKAQINS